jgi:phosphoribosylformylglycinamidine synthase
VARVVVDVMLKPEILDPQGQAVANALPRLGVGDVAAVRIGRRIEIDFTGEPDLAQAREIADKLLANPVIEDFTIRVEDPAPARGGEPGGADLAVDAGAVAGSAPVDEVGAVAPATEAGEADVPVAVDEAAGPEALDEPVVDEPVVDEPVVDEPVVDEPMVDAPVLADAPDAGPGGTATADPAEAAVDPDAVDTPPAEAAEADPGGPAVASEPAPAAAGGDEGRAGT